MIKTSIWINRNRAPAKCIFKGMLPFTPRLGDGIVVREGFCIERVQRVTWYASDSSVLIELEGFDEYNEYGDCIYNTKGYDD